MVHAEYIPPIQGILSDSGWVQTATLQTSSGHLHHMHRHSCNKSQTHRGQWPHYIEVGGTHLS